MGRESKSTKKSDENSKRNLGTNLLIFYAVILIYIKIEWMMRHR